MRKHQAHCFLHNLFTKHLNKNKTRFELAGAMKPHTIQTAKEMITEFDDIDFDSLEYVIQKYYEWKKLKQKEGNKK